MINLDNIIFTCIIALTGVAVGVFAWVLSVPSKDKKVVVRRGRSKEDSEHSVEFGGLRRARAIYTNDKFIKAQFMKILERLGSFQKEGEFKREFSKLYANAGWPRSMSDNQILGIVYFIAIIVTLLYCAVLVFLMPVLLLGAPLMGFAVGYLLVKQWMKSCILKRFSSISKMMPYIMDILSMTMNAGASLQSAIELIVLNYSHHPIGEEFDAMMYDIERGASIAVAMGGFRERLSSISIVQSFADEVINAIKFGRPIATLLENSSVKFKKLRVLEAQDRAGRAKVMILVPGFIILIGSLILLFGPFVLKFMNDSDSLGITF